MEEKQEKTKTDRAPHIPLVKTPEEPEKLSAKEKFEKIERFAYDVKNFIDFLGKTHEFDEDDMRTAHDIIYHLSREKKNGEDYTFDIDCYEKE